MKSHAVIEKTAKFIVGHGTSMEIILKAKQGSNPMFNFLNFSDELNPYYKYLVMALVSNAYKPVPEDHGPQDESSPSKCLFLQNSDSVQKIYSLIRLKLSTLQHRRMLVKARVKITLIYSCGVVFGKGFAGWSTFSCWRNTY